jgi:hypothetical protein
LASVVVKTAQVSCTHQFVLDLSALPARSELVVDDVPVLTVGSTGTVAGCTNPPASGGPCTQVMSWTGASMMLEVGGEPAILATSVPVTDKGPGSVKSAGQNKLESDG